ncbi:hypothetical protein N1851_029392 [Merluccius polli]|uniref:Uncharacterized protein n=1 Tax=Merluccius polli TaxID=89951 RepID=A0AA47M798_MERPO|nr:hypothetical protein N1851_029392 [Merluccius polli]
MTRCVYRAYRLGRPIYPSYIWVDAPTCDVTGGQEWLITLSPGGRLKVVERRRVISVIFPMQALSSSRLNREPDYQDSYARHTVAPRAPRPSTAPHRLHMLPDSGPADPGSDRLPQPTSQASSPEGGAHGKHFITRKVLRY